jgi:kynurenine formamidase
MKTMIRLLFASSILIGPLAAQSLDVTRFRIIDLTHAYNAKTVYWPTAPSRFSLERLAYGPTEAGYFYSAYRLSTPEHGGTHLDAPAHFSEKGLTAEAIPLERLMGSAVVIDVSSQAAASRDYRLTREDVLAFEKQHGRIEQRTIVLLRTGWSRHWPDAKAYLGDDTPNDATKLSFPGYGEDAARFLVEDRQVGVLGVDTASIDYGRSTDFLVHRIAAARNVPGFENLTNLEQLPPRGATAIALPMKIEGGSGGPLRIVALVPR